MPAVVFGLAVDPDHLTALAAGAAELRREGCQPAILLADGSLPAARRLADRLGTPEAVRTVAAQVTLRPPYYPWMDEIPCVERAEAVQLLTDRQSLHDAVAAEFCRYLAWPLTQDFRLLPAHAVRLVVLKPGEVRVMAVEWRHGWRPGPVYFDWEFRLLGAAHAA